MPTMDPRGQLWTIAEGKTTSNWIDTRGVPLIGFRVPEALVGSSVSFMGSLEQPVDVADMGPVKFKGTLIEIPVVAGDFITLDPIELLAVTWLSIVSDATETAVDGTVFTPVFRSL